MAILEYENILKLIMSTFASWYSGYVLMNGNCPDCVCLCSQRYRGAEGVRRQGHQDIPASQGKKRCSPGCPCFAGVSV